MISLIRVCYCIKSLLFITMIFVGGISLFHGKGYAGYIALAVVAMLFIVPSITSIIKDKNKVYNEDTILNAMGISFVALHYYTGEMTTLMGIVAILFFYIDFIIHIILRTSGHLKLHADIKHKLDSTILMQIQIILAIVLIIVPPLMSVTEVPVMRGFIYIVTVVFPLYRLYCMSTSANYENQAVTGVGVDCGILILIYHNSAELFGHGNLFTSTSLSAAIIIAICGIDIIRHVYGWLKTQYLQ